MPWPVSALPATSVLGKMPAQCQEYSGHTLGQEALKRHQAARSSGRPLRPVGGFTQPCRGLGLRGTEPKTATLANGMPDPVEVGKGQGPLGRVGRCRQPSGKVTTSSPSSLIKCLWTPPTRPVNQVLRGGPYRPRPQISSKQVSSRTSDSRTHLTGDQ